MGLPPAGKQLNSLLGPASPVDDIIASLKAACRQHGQSAQLTFWHLLYLPWQHLDRFLQVALTLYMSNLDSVYRMHLKGQVFAPDGSTKRLNTGIQRQLTFHFLLAAAPQCASKPVPEKVLSASGLSWQALQRQTNKSCCTKNRPSVSLQNTTICTQRELVGAGHRPVRAAVPWASVLCKAYGGVGSGCVLGWLNEGHLPAL